MDREHPAPGAIVVLRLLRYSTTGRFIGSAIAEVVSGEGFDPPYRSFNRGLSLSETFRRSGAA
jgi:hypothetical protein